ncbi:equilibrative nucleoside transporter 1 isoform X1 [Harp seal herpesvirus]|uniref:Equilibrative nucleoside transporter 1 isoform X1 n=1 Tax=phocid gammaherpesvirus 3 TaxID=2560643 RepID=A0A0R5XSX5_9GAMA|nr:equilibrative nucleoside transporter 1 isoform X1 [Harp seal herpesvirus]AJG42984.1 equilibrative nucleoside transporter 1 isoform X1 [Harp seal herpesvirus]
MKTHYHPQDKYNYVWMVFSLLAMSSVLPWNLFITATSYFTLRLSHNGSLISDITDSNVTALTVLSQVFPNSITFSSMCSILLFTYINCLLQKKISKPVRIAGSLLGILGVFLFTAVLVLVPMEAVTFFTVTIITVIITNSFGAILQGSLFTLISAFPPIYMTAFIIGQGLAGLFTAAAMLITIAVDLEPINSIFTYFLTASGIITIGIFVYLSLPALKFFRFYTTTYTDTLNAQLVFLLHESRHAPHKAHHKKCGFKTYLNNKYKSIMIPATSICALYAITIGLFPSVAVDLKPEVNATTSKYFIPVTCFLNYNCFDFIGRVLTMFIIWPKNNSVLVPVIVLCRLVLVPLILLCNIQPRHNLPVLFFNPVWYALFIALLAFSNGYFTGLCILTGHQKTDYGYQGKGGVLMTFFMVIGLALGAALSFIFRLLL